MNGSLKLIRKYLKLLLAQLLVILHRLDFLALRYLEERKQIKKLKVNMGRKTFILLYNLLRFQILDRAIWIKITVWPEIYNHGKAVTDEPSTWK